MNDQCSDCDHSGVGSLSTQLRANLDVSSADSGIPPPRPLVGRGRGELLRSSTAVEGNFIGYRRQLGLERPDLQGDVCYVGHQTESSDSSVQQNSCVRNAGVGNQMCRPAACKQDPREHPRDYQHDIIMPTIFQAGIPQQMLGHFYLRPAAAVMSIADDAK